ncbi:MAG: hypothetical protein KBD78_08985 [Oligoflexales bacterium]|nr:hypothetical protein [Oligoflexales bacterium]
MKKNIFLVLMCIGISSSVFAYPVDPNKVPVEDVDLQDVGDFTLAYDSIDKSIVYYAPMGGRVAVMNGQPLLGFVAGPHFGYLNAQLEFGVFGNVRDKLFAAIKAAGYIARPFPYIKTIVKPITPLDPATGKPICDRYTDIATGLPMEDCSKQMFSKLSFSTKGPSLNEYVPVTLILNEWGSLVYKTFLKSGNALQMALDTVYYSAGTGFKAVVEVNFEKLFENFHAYAAYHDGVCTDIEIETFWRKEGLCVDKSPDECSIKVDYWDDRGNKLDNVTIDPDSKNAEKVLQAIERLKDQLQDEMLIPLEQKLSPADTKKPSFGFKLSAKYEKQNVQKHAKYEFSSPIGVNVSDSTISAAIACIKVADSGNVSRDFEGDCKYYWEGTLGWEAILAAQHEKNK